MTTKNRTTVCVDPFPDYATRMLSVSNFQLKICQNKIAVLRDALQLIVDTAWVNIGERTDTQTVIEVVVIAANALAELERNENGIP